MKTWNDLEEHIKVVILSSVSGISAFIAWLVSLPPESQDAFIKPMIELTPISWRPEIGFMTRAIAVVTAATAAYKASKSGPVITLQPQPPAPKP